MERSIGLFEAKTRLSEICQEVATGGGTVRVTRRGAPWVRIVAEERDGAEADVWSARERWEKGKKKGLGRKAIPLPGGEEENRPIWKG